MKKVVVLAAVVMTAIASQAYDVKWSALNILTPAAKDVTKSETGIVGAGAAMSGLTVSLYWVSTSGDVFIKDYTSDSGKIASDVLGNESSDLYKAMVEDRGS